MKEAVAKGKNETTECVGCGELRRQLTFAWELVGKLSNREPILIPPPDTAGIVKEAISGVAVIVNGWKETAVAGMAGSPPPTLSFEDQGLDDRAGIPNVDDFVPPWENMGPVRAGWVNPPTNGNYTPYVPGDGNTVPPAGGVE